MVQLQYGYVWVRRWRRIISFHPVPNEDDDFGASNWGRRCSRSAKPGDDKDAGDQESQPSRRAQRTTAPKIENYDLIASAKSNALLVSVEGIQGTLRDQIKIATEVFKSCDREDAPRQRYHYQCVA